MRVKALSPYLNDGYDHAVWGADVTLVPLNPCAETPDGIRNHSWSRPAPTTPEGEACRGRTVLPTYATTSKMRSPQASSPSMLPGIVSSRCGTARSQQLGTFVRAMLSATEQSGRIGMTVDVAEALSEFEGLTTTTSICDQHQLVRLKALFRCCRRWLSISLLTLISFQSRCFSIPTDWKR